jgi:4-amino-4-deoxy-L-arabinose transferase-like glycosyltransferase
VSKPVAHHTPLQTLNITERLGEGRTLLVVLAIYFAVNIAVRLILPHGLELDEAEQTFMSQWMLAGYGSQPPFYNWLQHGMIEIFGMSLLTLAGLKNLMLFAAYALYYLAARQVMDDKRLAVIAALGLLTIPQVSFEAQRDLSHTVAAIFGSSLFVYSLLRLLSAPSLVAFLLFGIATGIGGITKYNFALVPIAAGLAVLMDRDMRRIVLNWRLLPAAVVALAIIAPHALWLLDNFQAAGGHTMKKLVDDDTGFLAGLAHGFGSLILSTLGFLALTFVILAAVYREHLKAIFAASSPWTRLVGRILLLSLGLIALMIVFAGLENVRDRWLTPILLIAPLYLALKIDAAKVPAMPGLKRLWIVAGIIMVLIPSVLFGRAAMDRISGKYGYVNIPFASVARAVAERAEGANTVIVASDGQLGGNMHYNLPDLPVLTPRPPTGMTPQPLTDFDRIVLVWRKTDGSPPPSFDEEFSDYLRQQGITAEPQAIAIVGYPYQWGRPGDQYRFGYAVIDLKQ